MGNQAVAATELVAPTATMPEGLTSALAATRLKEVGANTIAMAAPNRLAAFLGKFWGLIPWMLEIAIILA